MNAHAKFTNSWQIGGGYNVNQRYFDDTACPAAGLAVCSRMYNGLWYYVNSDDRHAVSFSYNGEAFARRLRLVGEELPPRRHPSPHSCRSRSWPGCASRARSPTRSG